MLKKFAVSLAILAATGSSCVNAEVESITIRWTSQLCQKTCGMLLEKELKKVNGVDKVAIDLGAGQASLTWKPMTPFSYTSINTAMHMVGIALRDIRLRVRGHIRHTGETIYLVSEGDNTRFDLVNPVVPNLKGQSTVYNASGRKLTPELRQQLLDAEKNGQIATIEGPVFMPERMTVPVQIVVDSLKLTELPRPAATTTPR